LPTLLTGFQAHHLTGLAGRGEPWKPQTYDYVSLKDAQWAQKFPYMLQAFRIRCFSSAVLALRMEIVWEELGGRLIGWELAQLALLCQACPDSQRRAWT